MAAHLIYLVCFFIFVRCINAHQLLVVSLNAGYTRCHSDRIFSVQTKSQTHSACSFPVRHTPGDSFTAAHDSLTVLKSSWLAWLLWRMSVSIKKNPLEDIVLVKRVSWQMSGAWNLLLKKCYTILCSEGWVENDHGWGCMIKSFRVKWSFHREGGWDNRPTNSKESYPLCSTDGASFLKIQLTTGDLYYDYYFFFLPVFQVTRITYFINVESVSFTINALVCGTSVSEIYRYEWTSQRLAETGRSSRCTQNLDELVFTCAEPVCPFVRALLAFRQI